MSEILVSRDGRRLGYVDVAERTVDLDDDVDVRPMLESVVGGTDTWSGPDTVTVDDRTYDRVDVAYMSDDAVTDLLGRFLTERGYDYEVRESEDRRRLTLD